MMEHLPIVMIVLPLLSAVVTPVAGRIHRVLSWYIVVIVTALCFAGSLSLLSTVLETGRISYWLGGWEPPWGIEYLIDYLNAFVLCLVAFIAFIVAVYAKKSVELEIDEARLPLFYGVYLLFVTGLMGIVITGDIFNLYVFLEIASLAGYALIAIAKRREAAMASFNYLVMGTIGATFVLLGIGHLYMVTGSLNMADLAQRLPALYGSKVVQTAFAFFAVGLSIKIALFPLHNWLPNSYTYAPSAVSAIMAATATKVGAYAFIRVMFTVFHAEFLITGIHLNHLLLFFAALAILMGSILAVAQTDIKKMLAYSSIGQIGYIILGISLMNLTGIQGSLLHIVNHALMKGTLFLAVGGIVYRLGITTIEDFKDLGRKMPVSMAAFTVGAFSMIGVPLTVGFVSKWYLAIAALEAGMWYLIIVLMLSSLLTAVYFWRVIDNMYFQPHDASKVSEGSVVVAESNPKDAPVLMLLPTIVTAVLCVFFGIFASLPLSLAEKASMILLR
ncbi:MAG TPA: monovalent cation/H+ antiporter subunit D family protein [Desulfotomaculum sp.]|nr:monovalent cation/H+ antiporter subunit D family protein [Desulfotomaculum sp.]